ncbi:hypothetical protein GUJ93_ZPchr0003g16715 [Zizania palustris]|uniref:Uncharacterized protein n=1 Tax=Zizania palustris TaxID=103762 RepID=A0A8J5VE79_ZIZPA|nr:hypothetical protein GUJ93_ZPchr0003g16715 [Zizania palustris]
MAAHGAGDDVARQQPAPPPRQALSLPPCSADGSSFFASASEASPDPLALAVSLFPGAPSPSFQGSFTQLLAGAMGPPAAPAPAPSSPSPFVLPPGLSPTALFSPTVTNT